MTAQEFIKQYGWEMSKAFLNNWSSLSEDYGFKVDDLKQLVDAWELVSTYSDMDTAKFFSSKQPDNLELKQAIELVESVNENN